MALLEVLTVGVCVSAVLLLGVAAVLAGSACMLSSILSRLEEERTAAMEDWDR